MAYRGYRERSRRNLGKIAGIVVSIFLIVVIIVGWFLLQDAIVFTAEGMRFEPGSLFRTAEQQQDGSVAVTLPKATTAATASAEMESFEPAAPPELDVETANLPGEMPEGEYVGRILPRSVLSTAEFEATVRLLASTGEQMVLIELKSPTGRLGYQSGSSLASRAGANATVTEDFYLRDAVRALKEAGIKVYGRICCLEDNLLTETDEALRLRNDKGHALQSSGGNALLDPSQTAVQDYLTAIATEAAAMGFDGLVLDGLYLPDSAATEEGALRVLVRSIVDVLGSKPLGLFLRTGKGITQPEELYGYMDSLWGDESATGIRYQVDGAGRLIQK